MRIGQCLVSYLSCRYLPSTIIPNASDSSRRFRISPVDLVGERRHILTSTDQTRPRPPSNSHTLTRCCGLNSAVVSFLRLPQPLSENGSTISYLLPPSSPSPTHPPSHLLFLPNLTTSSPSNHTHAQVHAYICLVSDCRHPSAHSTQNNIINTPPPRTPPARHLISPSYNVLAPYDHRRLSLACCVLCPFILSNCLISCLLHTPALTSLLSYAQLS